MIACLLLKTVSGQVKSSRLLSAQSSGIRTSLQMAYWTYRMSQSFQLSNANWQKSDCFGETSSLSVPGADHNSRLVVLLSLTYAMVTIASAILPVGCE